MIFTPTKLAGAFVIELERLADERGFFARSFCQHEFEAHGLDTRVAQCNVSFNARTATLRGMHLQRPPCAEAKLVRCTAGSLYDVIIDLRPGSPSFCQHVGFELTARNHRMLFIPEGFAHGFLTLEPDTEVFYQMSQPYAPGQAAGVRWDDPAFGVDWPIPVQVISERDRTYPDFTGRLP